MSWAPFAIFVVALLAMVGGAARFVVARIDRWTSSLSLRLDKVDRHLGEQDVKIARIEGRMGGPGRR